MNLEDHDMGVPENLRSDKGLYQALKILRLLHIQVTDEGFFLDHLLIVFHVQDLRSLQDHVNNTIEDVQRLTADPKTDTRLGKVGR